MQENACVSVVGINNAARTPAVARKLLVLMVTLPIHERDFNPDWATSRHAP